MFPPSVGEASSEAIGIQSDGKIVAGGYAGGWPYGNDFAVARYEANGNQDIDFGSEGVAHLDFGANLTDRAHALAVQSDSRIVLAGDTLGVNASGVCALARYNADGTLDPTFGESGKLTFVPGSCSSVALQPDGKILVAGYSHDLTGMRVFLLARLNPNGTPDTGFGTNGSVLTFWDDVPGAHGGGSINAISVLADGKILAAGVAGNSFALARYDSNGTLDVSFGTEGKVATIIGGPETVNIAYALGVQADGRIVAAGTSDAVGTRDFILLRYNEDGSVDDTFGLGGKVVTDFSGAGSDDWLFAITIQEDQRILVAGQTGPVSFTSMALARYNPDGSLDETFGQGGKALTIFAGESWVAAIAIQPDHRILVSGFAGAVGSGTFALARYLSDFGTPEEEANNLVDQAACLPADPRAQKKLAGGARGIVKAVMTAKQPRICKATDKYIGQLIQLQSKGVLHKDVRDEMIYNVLKFDALVGCPLPTG